MFLCIFEQTRCSITPLQMSGLTPTSHRACIAYLPLMLGTQSPASLQAWSRLPQAPTSWLRNLEHRLHSASPSLQATPNSTIHSLGPPTHPRLADLWGAAQVEEVTLTLEPEPCSLTPSPLREEAPTTRGSSPGIPPQTSEPIPERIPFDVTPCVVQSLEEKDEEVEEGSIVIVATN
ncbi:hypothetical protein GOODEAATRI_018908 [Goodea atripinnis]|uniref:Uncharacterized protein n=1 Tax=Goodea atripinnis TaxID=208336 RepID=A0ABV0NW81_9TELE